MDLNPTLLHYFKIQKEPSVIPAHHAVCLQDHFVKPVTLMYG